MAQVCKTLGISEQTYYRWRRAYGGLRVTQDKGLKELETLRVKLEQLLRSER